MRLLIVCKRRPQQRDLLARPYGRFHYLPMELAARGHEVRVLLIDHQDSPAASVERNGVTCIALDWRRQGWFGVRRALRGEAASFAPDWVIGCSDAWAGVLAHGLATRFRARLALDAYDNFEAYMPWNLPLHRLWRRAVRAADLVTAAGPQLAALLDRERSGGARTRILPMAADPGFYSMSQAECRAVLNLPVEASLVVYMGGWAANRGTDMLAVAFRILISREKDARLVLSGKPPAAILTQPWASSTGYLPDDMLPVLLNSADVACVITTNSSFGRYSYPAKLCEAMACGIPVAATGTESVRWMLNGHESLLSLPDDAQGFAENIQGSLRHGRFDYGPLPTWQDGGRRLHEWLVGDSHSGVA
jgi:glycosyltransferase involved in cell wall biosynthesis